MGEFPRSGAIDTYLDELLLSEKDATVASEKKLDSNSNYNNDDDESGDRRTEKRPVRNREAVRKYREKKKARAASLEEEVVRLRAVNQQLERRLQSRAALEAEAARLKCLLVDIRGRIEGEIGSFPYHKSGLDPLFQNAANLGL